MSSPDLIIRGRRVLLPDEVTAATIHVRDGRVECVGAYDEIAGDCEVFEAAESDLIMPGLVDTHVHINEPGRTEWEGFKSATRAAAAGGVTTVIDMPLNSIPPTTTAAGLSAKLAAANGNCFVDVGFWGGVVPGNLDQLATLSGQGVVGFKCFLVHSGVDEFPHVTEDDLRLALPELRKLDAVLIVHAELPGPIEAACEATNSSGASAHNYETFLSTRPRSAEDEAVKLMIRLSREFDSAVHIVHHSSADALPSLRAAKASGVKITAETCPHYLVFAAEEIPDGATEFKCCPPIRERDNREELWKALSDGTIDFIVSDHSPCPASMKLPEEGDFLKAWGGISSLQLRLPVMWTAAQERGYPLQTLARWVCEAPARLVKLDRRKGRIANGYDADIVVWSADEEFTLDAQNLHHRHQVTPYNGRRLAGVVRQTFLRGKKIYDCGVFTKPQGSFLLAQTSTRDQLN